ncbi:hypothetical protein HGO41_24115 [Rahnella sp. CG8]|uniref:DNA-binding protein n=1 Tax=Rahnella sp. CG8 TaxID=2726078 RepID=UPI0020349BCD|nr:DNA-binding protein [Rahnella sp. CG8]MCM2448241.1 hypothetical protein [Rahnella sp. CG8]
MRPVTFTPEDIIDAGKALQAEGRPITGFALRKKVGGGDQARLRKVWDDYQAGQLMVMQEPVAELPVEVAEEVKAVSSALAERIGQLAVELNDKAVKAAERRVAEITRAAGEQTAQAERELADAASMVNELESDLDALRDTHAATAQQLAETQALKHQLEIDLAQVKERLAAAKTRLVNAEQGAQLAAEQHNRQQAEWQDRVNELKTRLDDRERSAAAAAEHQLQTVSDALEARDTARQDASTEREEKAALLGELKAMKEQNAALAELLASRDGSPGAASQVKGKKAN